MPFVTHQQQVLHSKTNSFLYKEALAGKFSTKAAFKLLRLRLKSLTADELRTEQSFVYDLFIRALRSQDARDYRRYRRPTLGGSEISRLMLKNGLDPSKERTFEQLSKLRDKVNLLCQLKKAEKSFNGTRKKDFGVLSKTKVLAILRRNKNSSIIYDCGIYVLTPKKCYGGVIVGIIEKGTIDSLCAAGKIKQTPYFNSDGRKCFELSSRVKGFNAPDWMKESLPSSYLSACGVR